MSLLKKVPALIAGLCLTFCNAASNAESVKDSQQRIPLLETKSFWRSHITLRPPVYGAEPHPVSITMPHTECPPPGWKDPAFNDSDWHRYRGPFFSNLRKCGWRIVACPNGFRNEPTLALLCVRGKFRISDPARIKSLILNTSYRGGVIVYLNGKEVARGSMPDGKISSETPAEEYPRDAFILPDGKILARKSVLKKKYPSNFKLQVRSLQNISVPCTLLRKGLNVLAIEVHRSPYHPDLLRVRRFTGPTWGTVGLVKAELSTGDPAGAAKGNKPDLCAWNIPVLQRVHAENVSDADEGLLPIRIVGTRNGCFSGQLVIGLKGELKDVRAAVGDLKHKGGCIPASSIQVRYAKPGPPFERSQRHLFDALLEKPPAQAPFFKKRGGSLQPIWVTVNVPADAVAGEYKASLTVEAQGFNPIDVPLVVTVCPFCLPTPAHFRTHTDFVQSPESVALQYKVPLWSDEHFKLVERSFTHLSKAGNRIVHLRLIAKTYMGNDQTMVRWIPKGDGTYDYDFTPLEKYLDAAERGMGKPRIVCLYVWSHYIGGEGRKAWWKTKPAPRAVLVSTLDPKTGKVSELQAPHYDDPGAAEFWKPMIRKLVERLKKRGLDKRIMLGISGDMRPSKKTVALWTQVLPGAGWFCVSHFPVSPKSLGGPVGSTAYAEITFPGYSQKEFRHGWKKPDSPIVLQRGLQRGRVLTNYRLLPELCIETGHPGFGWIMADYWPVRSNKSITARHRIGGFHYPYRLCHAWMWIDTSVILGPGPDGAVSTVRLELLREGLQENEALICIDQALSDPAMRKRLGNELVKHCEALMEERYQCTMWGKWGRHYEKRYGRESGYFTNAWLGHCWFVSSGWQKRSQKLYSTAAQVREALK